MSAVPVRGDAPDDAEDEARPLVVVGFDGSEKDGPALRWAVDAANAFDTSVLVVHAVGLLESSHATGTGAIAAGLSDSLRAVIQDVGGAHPPDIELRLVPGTPSEVLLATVASEQPRFLVVGRGTAHHRHTSTLGSVSRSVVDRCPVPVIVVPADLPAR